jgi:hypothetical protein
MLFPDWINGWQCVQLALWAWAGVGKIGPWFQPVIPFITKDSAYTWLLPKQLMCKLLVKDYPDDLNPSNLSTILAYMGAALEVAFPLCCSTPVDVLVSTDPGRLRLEILWDTSLKMNDPTDMCSSFVTCCDIL